MCFNIYQQKLSNTFLIIEFPKLSNCLVSILTASPQVASSSAGDCAFEDDMCGWTNPGRQDGIDELNWERLEARGEPRYPQVRLCNQFGWSLLWFHFCNRQGIREIEQWTLIKQKSSCNAVTGQKIRCCYPKTRLKSLKSYFVSRVNFYFILRNL